MKSAQKQHIKSWNQEKQEYTHSEFDACSTLRTWDGILPTQYLVMLNTLEYVKTKLFNNVIWEGVYQVKRWEEVHQTVKEFTHEWFSNLTITFLSAIWNWCLGLEILLKMISEYSSCKLKCFFADTFCKIRFKQEHNTPPFV